MISSQIFGQGFNINHYNNEDGLPDQIAYDVTQLKNGKMLFVHKKYISLYDGQNWELLPENQTKKLYWNKLQIDNNNNIWVGSVNLFGKTNVFKNNKWHGIPNDNLTIDFYTKFGSGRTHDFVVNQIGDKINIAKCDESSVFFYNKRWEKLELPNTLHKPRLNNLEFINNKLFISASEGLFIFENNSIKHLRPEIFGAPNNNVLSVVKYSNTSGNEQLWILSDSWLGYLENGKFQLVAKFPSLPIYDITVNHFFFKVFEKDIFFGNQNIVCYKMKNKPRIRILTIKDGLIADGATQVYEDREKNVWLTSFRGISKLKRRPFLIYKNYNGLLEDEVTSVDQLPDGRIILGYPNGIGYYKNYKFTNRKFEGVSEYSGSFRRVFDIYVENKNTSWLAATNIGVGRLNSNGNLKWYNTPEKEFYYCLLKDKKNFLIGTFKGLSILKNGQLVKDKITFQKKYYIKQIKKYDNDTYILVTNNELVLYDFKTVKPIKNGDAECFYCVDEINKKEFYVGTTKGLFHLKNEKLRRAKLGTNEIYDEIYFIKKDTKDNLWIGTNNGVFIWTGEDLHHVNTEEGLPHNETNRDAGFCDNEGNFWVGTARGLVKFENLPAKTDSTKPLLYVNKFEDFTGVVHQFNKEISRDNDDNSFTILLNGLSFIDENKLQYEISILDHNHKQTNTFIQKDNKYRVSNLTSGEYSFSVRVKNPLGIWSDISEFKIIIGSPFYKKAWFIITILILVVLIVLFIQNFLHQKKYSKDLLNEVDERTRSLNISNKKYRIISETIDEVIWSFDKNLKLDYVSPTVKKLFGYSQEAINRLESKQPIIERLCNRFEEFHIERIKKEIISSEFKYSEGPNKNRFFEIYTSPIINNNFQGVIGVTREISQRVAKERVKSAAIVHTIEKERTRIARDLHDHLGQILASIKLRMEMFQLRNVEDPDIEEAYSQLTVVKRELKFIIEDLNPLPYGKVDLIEALQDLCSSYRRKKESKIEIVFKSNVEFIELEEEKRLLIFRIAQEALTNAITHSKASLITIQLISFPNQFILSVIDNGCGFEQIQAKKNQGFGFQNMKQRAAILGAEFHVDSKIDQGTKIILKI